jgi:hypothetical protein
MRCPYVEGEISRQRYNQGSPSGFTAGEKFQMAVITLRGYHGEEAPIATGGSLN